MMTRAIGAIGRTARLSLAGAVVLALACAEAHAADYWVGPGGDDGASGLSPANAWATLGHAADAVGPGDTVHVQDGQYEGFYLTTSGTPGDPITFVAEGTAVEITADNPVTPDGINLEGASHVVLDGFVVNGRTRAGIRAVTAEFVTVRNCRLGGNGRWGILTGFVDDFLAEGNEAHHSQAEHGIYVSNSCVRPIVRDNVVYANAGNGLHFNGDESLGGSGLIEDALVERNVIYDNGVLGGSGINMDGGVGGVIRNNLLFDNHASGISLYRIDASAGASGNLVVNNTIVQAADGRWCVNIADGSTNNVVRNNILWNAHPFRGAITIDAASRPGFVSDHNVVISRFSTDGGDTVVGLATWQGLGYDAHSLVATPAELFIAPGSDVHLLAGAPAVDAGTPAGAPPADLDGNPRPAGTAVDVGAYELVLLECGDGGPDPGEQCGEPGLACGDPCTTCVQCACAPAAPVCGDGLVCGAETCESDGDCAGGQVCQGCACVTPLACTSGVAIRNPALRLRGNPMALTLRGKAVLPGIDPAASGVRVVVDAAQGPGVFDATVPGGPAWSVNAQGTRWRYVDPTGAAGGVTRVVVRDRSRIEPGLVRWLVRAGGGAVALPDPADVRAAVLFDPPDGCAAFVFAPPGAPRPRCDVRGARLRCR
jgi:hypothetical protein